MTATLFYQTDGVLELSDFHYDDDAGAKVYINDATGSLDIVDKAGTVLESAVPLTYIAASDGRYKAAIRYNIAFTKKGKYVARVTMLGAASGLHYYGELEFTVIVDS